VYRGRVDITRVAVKVASEASGKVVPFSGPIVEAVLKEVLDLQDEQIARLKTIEDGVQRLLDGPWKAGRIRLKEASLPGRTPDSRRALLNGAADDFRDAIPLQPDPSCCQAQVTLDLSMTLAVLGDRPAQQHYAWQAYLTARRTLWDLANNKKAPRTREWTKNPKSPSAFKPDYTARLYQTSEWFVEFELTTSAFVDPDARPSYAAERYDDERRIRPRDGVPLDHHYLTRRHERGDFELVPTAWTIFAAESEDVVANPEWPPLRPYTEIKYLMNQKDEWAMGYTTPE
jgi:hypothetical protein